MPLIHGKSKRAFEENIKSEREAGKPMKQSLAIAYAVKRKAQKKALGGEIEPEDLVHKVEHLDNMAQEHEELDEPKEPMEHLEEDADKYRMAKGGMLSPKHLLGKVMQKRMMASGGEVTQDPKKVEDFEKGIRKAFKFAEGGEIKLDPEKVAQFTFGARKAAHSKEKEPDVLPKEKQAYHDDYEHDHEDDLIPGFYDGGEVGEEYLKMGQTYPDPDNKEFDSLDEGTPTLEASRKHRRKKIIRALLGSDE